MRLKNKVALITGASRGIGREIALLFAQEGAHVIINYNNSQEEALLLKEEIEILNSKALCIKADISIEEEVIDMVKKSLNEFENIDILVNNAGIVLRSPLLDTSLEDWKKIQDTNLQGTFLCSKYVSKEMLKNKGGSIVNISSTNGINSFFPRTASYDASKAAINILTRDFAKELGPNIRVNAVAPGWVVTDMGSTLTPEFIKEESEKIYLKRFAKPKEIAQAVVFLASDESSYISGSILKIDGGYG